jgi:hypothetical protein
MISYLAMAMFGMLPLGSLLVGAISQKIGAPDTLLCQGVTAILIALAFSNFLRKDTLEKKKATRFEEAEEMLMEKI